MQQTLLQSSKLFAESASETGSRWHGLVHWCCRRYFSRITVHNEENLPAAGPVLYVALHRNGAVDGFVLHGLLPRVRFLISRQLRESAFYRLFFNGIEVVRPQDVRAGENPGAANRGAMDSCLELLQAGGELLVFPEGTSSLGPSHLPFQSGAARLAARFSTCGQPLPVVPIGIRYEEAWAFRSRVELWVGEPIVANSATPREMRDAIAEGLESVGINVATEADQARLRQVAYVATLGSDHSYYEALKQFEAGVPDHLVAQFDDFNARACERGLARHQGVPLFAESRLAYTLAVLAAAPLLALAALLNLPVLLLSWLAAHKLAKEPNVIALARILVGLPLLAGWGLATAGAALALGALKLWAGCLAISWLGLLLCYRVRKLAVASFNSWFHPSLSQAALTLHRRVLTELERETEEQA